MSITTHHKTPILIRWGELGPTLSWCKDNCQGEWGYICIEPAGFDAGDYEFYFEKEVDQINFILWKK